MSERYGKSPPQRTPGVPLAVGKPRAHAMPAAPDPKAAREAWTLDLLAFARHGQVAARVDTRGDKAPLPPVVLAGKDRVIALDLTAAVAALRSRPRAFSQVAGRYSPLVVGARDKGVRLVLELWDLQDVYARDDNLRKLAEGLATYLQADVVLHDRTEARAALAAIDPAALPEALVARNPLAWLLNWRSAP